MKNDNIYIVLPAKDEGSRIGKVIDSILGYGYRNIVLVDDSSTDNTIEVGESYPSVVILKHVINLGSGAATKTGLDYAVQKGAKYIATIDADGQHAAKDLDFLLREIQKEEYDLIVGSRFLQENSIPKSRIFFNKVGNLISLMLTGKYVTDSQSGLKVLTGDLAKKISIEYNGFEFCMEIIKNAKRNKARIKELPIGVMYDKETTEKGQNLMSGLNMIKRILSPF
ncbi:MAG: glycosyltransferase family 2 protein [Saprospiraceae bacterium]|nr:glycosyltransferase family 2 protein [Saprospiraceae bacterium]